MQLRMKKPCYRLENFKDMTMSKFVDILNVFVNDNEQILFGVFEMNVEDGFNPDEKEFIKNRTAFSSNDWVLPWKLPFNEVPTTLWVKSGNIEEMEQLVRMGGYEITCIILERNEKNVKNLSYLIYDISLERDQGMVEYFYAIDRKGDDFEKRVLPKLKNIINNLECIQDSSLKVNVFG